MTSKVKSIDSNDLDQEPSDDCALVLNQELTNFEDVLNKLGGFGKFQILSLVSILSLEIPAAFGIFVPIFLGVPPKSWTCVNDTFEWTLLANESCSCPGELTTTLDTSLVAEWTLVCDYAWVSDFITSFQMVGTLFGNLYAGSFADRYGRKYACLGATLLMFLGQVCSAIAPNFYVYGAARFLAGIGFAGYILISAIYSMEFHTTEYRQVCGSVGPWGEGVMLLGLLAYLIRPWRHLCWATTVPFLLILGFFFVPESPRWLLRNNKVAEALRVTDTIARLNGKPPGTVQLATLKYIAKNEIKMQESPGSENGKVKTVSYLDMLRNRDLRFTTICLMTLWFSWSFTYFGISYNIRNMSGDPYLNVMFLGLTDVIGYPAGLLICNRIGRRKSVAFFMTWATVFLVALALFELIVGLISYPQLLLAFCLVGKFGASGARGCIRTLTGESYPTACRAKGSGLGGVAAGVAGIVAPQLAFIGTYWPSIPFFVFALVSIMGAVVSFLLSETMGKPMKEMNTENKKDVPPELLKENNSNGLVTRL
ncbi:unnamed protein product [Allacma fusca]|uniref:Major facilitator superfamily (MFS) profile domain-containing protein n=1 Tax=Allacma fusca TaxID=39272 RepID=A0A8J2KPM1_9HEXA|nr:unnamed protein product [Allacma fusca]